MSFSRLDAAGNGAAPRTARPELMLDSLLKALRAAVVVVGHAFIAAVLVGCASAVDHLILYLNDGHEMMVLQPVAAFLPISDR